ncbi:MAG TPA: c-type cytochrome [Thermoanaerobaculia bacterium]|jgi:cytochrome c oxidase subunit 2
MFVVFAVAAILWSFALVVRRGVLVVSLVVVAAAIASIALDVRAMQHAARARRSDVNIRIAREGDWWQLEYARGGTAFVTANELHVPIGTAVALSWSGLPAPSIGGAVCLPAGEDRCTLVVSDASAATFVGLWPPRWQRLPIVAEEPARFDEWLRNEAQPARGAAGGAALFASAGCGYCHVVRGEVAEASQLAPDLTHFAVRRTIAATDLPNRRGFLDGWVVHSAALKRGSAMPDNRLDPTVLRGVIAYLESLR